MKFTGVFAPPVMGSEVRPIKLTGPGYIEVTAEGLKVSGYRGDTRNLRILAVTVLVVSVLLAIILSRLNGFSETLLQLLVVFSVGACIIPLLLPNYQRSDEVWEFTLSWQQVAWIRPDPKDSYGILIRVHNFAPHGLLHFKPDLPSHEVLTDITTSGWFIPWYKPPPDTLWNRLKAYFRY